MSDKDLDRLAELIAEKIRERHDICHFSSEELMAIRNIIQTKKDAVRVFLYIFGALVIWVMRDLYTYIAGHLAFK